MSLGVGSFTALSPDGTRIAVRIDDPENTDVWVGDVGRGNLSRLTTDAAFDDHPLWTPDGERVVFTSDRDGSLGSTGPPLTAPARSST